MPVGEIILGAFLQALVAKLLEVRLVAGDLDAEVDGLKDTLNAILIIIDDAENKQDNNRIKLWLQRLMEESYNARDVLDEVEYEALRRDHVRFGKVRNSSLSSPFSARRWYFENTVAKKIEKIRITLDKLVRESCALNLREANNGSRRPKRTYSETGALGELNVFGRESDSNAILRCLFECSVASVDFISILGKAGLGKTTLARMVFNDKRVVRHFHIKMWVHASSSCQEDESCIFGEKEVIKATIQSITGETCNLPSLDIMQQHLLQLLQRKKYLLVLDGLLNDSHDFLDAVKSFLSILGAHGSKVLITTRKRSVGKLISTIYTHDLQSISNYDCEQMIRSFAYSDRNPNSTLPYLDRIIGMIVGKCNGLPLAAKRYGLLLRVENQREKWELIASKEVAQVIGNDVTQTLSSNVKRCFAYCSIFPRGYLFDKQQLIQLWLAQDFVQNEDEGSKYFDSMFHLSLFRLPPLVHSNTKQEYLMDDDIRSRAQLISGEECYPGNSHRLSETARHASLLLSTCSGSVPRLSRNSSSSSSRRRNIKPVDIESFYKAKGLYTLMLLAHPSNPVSVQIPDNLAKKLQRLRSLDLSNTGLLKLPTSVGDLKYLRYLALHNAKIKRLPDSLCELYLLQTLGLRNCYELIELPRDMRHLVNLRHLDLHLDDDCSRRHGGLTSMPWKIGKLTNLYTLSRFVVSKKEQCGLSQLRDMNNLHGSLTISGLEYVKRATDATDASLDQKKHLQILELLWGEGGRDNAIDVELLERIRPNINISEISIGGYRGYKLSSWIWDPSFSILAVLKLYNCMNLSELPPLGQLPLLRKLQLEGLPNWKSWSGRDDRELTSLQELVIRDCFNLYLLCPSLPSLLSLEIHGCPCILGLPVFPSLHSLKVKDSGEWIWKSLSSLKSISSLSLEGMSSASTLPTELQECTSMHRLEIINFAQLHFLSDDLLPLGLSHFRIEQCPLLQRLPLGLRLLEHLQVLQVRHCQGLLSLPPGMTSLRSLTYLELSDSPRLSFKPSDGLPAGLQILIVNNCQTLNQCLQQDWDDLRYRVSKVWIDGHLVVSAEEAAHSGASASRGNNSYS